MIRRGEAGEFPRVAEDPTLLIGRAQECFEGLRPGNGWHAWLVDQLALATVRLDRCRRADRRMRDLAIMRAEIFWDDGRVALAERIGGLALAAQGGAGWTAEQVGQAHDLLGNPPDARSEAPGLVVRFEGGRAIAEVPGPGELAAREVAGLRKRKAEVMPLEAMDRAMVEADLVIEPTPEMRKLGRHEAMLRGWVRWLVAQVRLEPPPRNSPRELFPQLPPVEAEKTPEAEPAPGLAPEAMAEVEEVAEVEVEEKPFGCRPPRPRNASGTRTVPNAGREAADDGARPRKREGRRA